MKAVKICQYYTCRKKKINFLKGTCQTPRNVVYFPLSLEQGVRRRHHEK
ncbi:hypothetical protein GCWU000246_01894 [Jonquetella anthropi E3_33 E1]|nr:hypothetical protein GCWU000246_01894 [Jonquetella anthropi E3_33 E1]